MSNHHSDALEPEGRDWPTVFGSVFVASVIVLFLLWMISGGVGPSLAGLGLMIVRVALTILARAGWAFAVFALILALVDISKKQSPVVAIALTALFLFGWLIAGPMLIKLAPYNPGQPVGHWFV